MLLVRTVSGSSVLLSVPYQTAYHYYWHCVSVVDRQADGNCLVSWNSQQFIALVEGGRSLADPGPASCYPPISITSIVNPPKTGLPWIQLVSYGERIELVAPGGKFGSIMKGFSFRTTLFVG